MILQLTPCLLHSCQALVSSSLLTKKLRHGTVKMSQVSVIGNITVCSVKTVPCAVLQLEVMCDVNSVWNLGL